VQQQVQQQVQQALRWGYQLQYPEIAQTLEMEH
jgi:hypothetical protein